VTEPDLVRVWTLELTELRPSRAEADVRRAQVPFGPLNAFFYAEVGRGLDWSDRLGWDAARWQAWAERVETWLVHDRGTPAGYAELDPAPGSSTVDLAYFGLLAPFRGRGLGGALLTTACAARSSSATASPSARTSATASTRWRTTAPAASSSSASASSAARARPG
jgi:GNAT superfamily N-acetyltransferase